MELYSKELDIVSSRVQECWQVSAVHRVPLGFVLVVSSVSVINKGLKLHWCRHIISGIPGVTSSDHSYNNRT